MQNCNNMAVFLKDAGRAYSYEDLLDRINNSYTYCPLFKSDNLYDYWCNLVIGIVADKPLVLLDADLGFGELDGINVLQVNKVVEIKKPFFSSSLDLVLALCLSKSEITIFTSGTTGQPKKIVHTIASLTRSVRRSECYSGQIWGFAYNPTHMAGLQVFFQAFENQNTLVNIFHYSRGEVYALIKANRITHISATPTYYRLLLPVEEVCPSVQRITLGGEKSEQRLYSSLVKIFPNAKINNIYASTEAGSLLAAKGENFQIPVALSDKFRVEEDELLIHKSLLGVSDNFCYLGDYYRTGDLIEWVNKERGIFKFKSRKNELINVGGYKVNPGEVETAILHITGVLQAFVYGKANSVLGNILCAEVKLAPNVELTELEIRQFLRSVLQDFKIPRRIKFVGEFSLTRTGKLKRI